MTKARTLDADPIVAEIREIKRRLAARFNYDAVKMLKDAQKRQARVTRKVVAVSRQKAATKSLHSAHRAGRGD